jgi:hypothetical protein
MSPKLDGHHQVILYHMTSHHYNVRAILTEIENCRREATPRDSVFVIEMNCNRRINTLSTKKGKYHSDDQITNLQKHCDISSILLSS